MKAPMLAAKSLRRAQQLAQTFKTLANVNRVRILLLLESGEQSVAQIELTLGVHQPTLSQQLGELRDAGLITVRRVAKSALYRVTEPRGRHALAAVHCADGQPAADAVLAQRSPGHQHAAVFASVLTRRGAGAPDGPQIV